MTDELDKMFARARELENQGEHFAEASSIADLERRIESWANPAKKEENELQVILFGDFQPPESTLTVPEIGLTVLPTPVKKSVARAPCVLEARITIDGHAVAAIQDAARRLDLFAGVWVLVNWAHGPVNWWSYVTHGSSAGASEKLDHVNCSAVINLIQSIPDEYLRNRVRAALYWIQEPQQGILESVTRGNGIRTFSAYWSAFECLVEGISGLIPMKRMTRPEKEDAISSLVQSWTEESASRPKFTCQQVSEMYRIVEPGMRAKARHVFNVLFKDSAQVDKYMDQCFGRTDKQNRLYQVRNDISHGNIDASDPLEAIRVEARVAELWLILWGMFGRLVPFGTPVDRDFAASASKQEK